MKRQIALAARLFAAATGAMAASLERVTQPVSVQVAGQTLQLNGMALRSKPAGENFKVGLLGQRSPLAA